MGGGHLDEPALVFTADRGWHLAPSPPLVEHVEFLRRKHMTASTRTDEGFVATMLRKGRSVEFVANASGWTIEELIALAEREEINVVHGEANGDGTAIPIRPPTPADAAPSRAAPTTIPATPVPVSTSRPNELPEVIRLGLSHRIKRIRTAAERARDAFVKLDEAFRSESGKAQARAEVERLEKQLRDAKARLRGGVAAPTSSPSPSESGTPRTMTPQSCSKCGKVCASAPGRASHERNCNGAAPATG